MVVSYTPKVKMPTLENPTYVDKSQEMYGTGIQKTATTSTPVISKDVPKTAPVIPDVTDINNMNQQQLNEYITKAQVYGIDQNNKDEMYRLAIAGQRATQLAQPQVPSTQAPYTPTKGSSIGREIAPGVVEDVSGYGKKTPEQLEREDYERKLREQEQANISAQERLLQDQYRQREGELQTQAEEVMQATQGALSFSGFGRSTYAAEKMAKIQESANQQKNILAQERDIALQKYKAEQQGATSEQLAAYDEYMRSLQQQQAEITAQMAQQTNEYNQQFAKTMQERIDNIMQTAYSYDTTPLTEEEMQLAETYGQFLVDEKGNIQESFLKQIPAKLVGQALKAGATVKQQQIKQGQGFSFMNIGDSTIARINDATGDVEFLTGPQAEKAVNDLPSDIPVMPGDWSQVVTEDTDLSTIPELVQKAAMKGEASVKNNNPSGVTYGFSPALKQKLTDAGINFEAGTQRPSGEGGRYVKFATVGDGLKAHYIVLSQTGWNDVYDRLYAWSAGGTKDTPEPIKIANKKKYAQSILDQAGIKKGTKFSQLTDQQIQKLTEIHIKMESPVFAEAVFGGGKQTAVSDKVSAQLELLKRGGMTNTQKAELIETASREGWLDQYKEALKQGVNVDLTTTQQNQYNKEYDRFVQNAVVKGFEEQIGQFQGLGYSLGDKSGPGDMAGIFSFMKALDPTSVVRETEFENAASSAGVKSKWKNIFDRLNEGKLLTNQQAKDFKRIAKYFIEAKAQSYDRKYSDMLNAFDKFGIDKSLAPAKATNQLRDYLGTNTGTAGTTGKTVSSKAKNILSSYGY